MLTKKMAEELSEFYCEKLQGQLSAFGCENFTTHGDFNGFSPGKFNVLIGVNLLREGLDLRK